jgi:hypothetical protein
MRYEKYTGKDGVEKEIAKINARDILLLGGKAGGAPREEHSPSVADLAEPNDDLPF